METHHHTHHSHEKRSWRSYFWEFLMLFLAVFCGYLAEYKLEHVVESNREKKYIRELFADLQADTVMIRKTIARAETMSKGLDSLKTHLYNYNGSKETDHILYRQNFNYMQWILPDFNDKTVAQLRYSGNFRLIRNEEVASEVSDYWIGECKIMRNAEEFIKDLDKAEDAMTSIFNRRYVTTDKYDPYYGLDVYHISHDAKLMTHDANTLGSFANRVVRMAEITEHYLIPFLRVQLKDAEDLLTLLKKEYHLK